MSELNFVLVCFVILVVDFFILYGCLSVFSKNRRGFDPKPPFYEYALDGCQFSYFLLEDPRILLLISFCFETHFFKTETYQ